MVDTYYDKDGVKVFGYGSKTRWYEIEVNGKRVKSFGDYEEAIAYAKKLGGRK